MCFSGIRHGWNVTTGFHSGAVTARRPECNQAAIRLQSVSWQVPVFAPEVFFRNPTQGVTVTQGYTQGCNTARRPEYKQFLASLKERGMGKSLLNDSGSPGG